MTIANKREDCYATVGVHPTRCNEFEENEAEKYFEELSVEAQNPKVLAIGECG